MHHEGSGERWCPRSTVAAIIERDNRFLLVEERIGGRLLLNQPAGHLEPNERFTEGVCREVLEETGWEATPTALLGLYTYQVPHKGLTFHRMCFIARAERKIHDGPFDVPIVQPLWLTRDEIAASAERLRSPLVLECIDHYLAGRSFPLDFIQD